MLRRGPLGIARWIIAFAALPGVLAAQGGSMRTAADARFLASPLLEDRIVGSRGAAVTASYVAAGLEAAGLEPLWDDGSYVTPTTVRRATTTGSIVIGFGPSTAALRAPDDVWAAARAGRTSADGPLVFGGYGVVAPATGRDDFGVASFEGRVVVLLDGYPDVDEATGAEGPSDAAAGLAHRKLEVLARLGAVGAVIITADGSPARLDPIGSGALELPGTLTFAVWAPRASIARIFEAQGRSLDVLESRARQERFAPIALGGHLVADFQTTFDLVTTPTVGARIAGSTAAALGSVVVLSHYDEAPGGPPHNALSLVALLETSRRLVEVPGEGRPVIVLVTPGSHGRYVRRSLLRSAHSVVVFDHIGAFDHGVPTIAGQTLSTLATELGVAAEALAPHPAGDRWMATAPQWVEAAEIGTAGVVIAGGSGSDDPGATALTAADLAARAVLELRTMPNKPSFAPNSPFSRGLRPGSGLQP